MLKAPSVRGAFFKIAFSGMVRSCLWRTPLCPVAAVPAEIDQRFIYFQAKSQSTPYPYTIAEYEQLTQLHYAPVLYAENAATYRLAQSRCCQLKQRKQLTKPVLWHSSYYYREIQAAAIAPVYIGWTGSIKEWGLFARTALPPGTFVGEYTGRLLLISFFQKSINPYSFHYPLPLTQWLWFTIDADRYGNETRYINHSHEPNCSSCVVYHEGMLRVVLYTRCFISPHEELSFDYGSTLWGHKRSFEQESDL